MSKQSRYSFHHLGIPTDEVKPGERYSAHFKMYTADHPGRFRIQFHRFEKDSPMHSLIQTVVHVALLVDDLDAAVLGEELLLGPYEPVPGYRVAIINNAGVPVELVETELTDDELWGKAVSQDDLSITGL